VALDLGSVRIGVALCDSGGTVATPYATVERRGTEAVVHGQVAELVDEVAAVAVVVGWPLSLDGSEGPAALAARREAARLAGQLAVPVVLHDERLTSVAAERSLRAQGGTGRSRSRGRDRRQGAVDQVAAAVLLQSWLDGGGPARVERDRLV
jgi:putative holliday junction resolvase